jgi:hypothetical protein
VVSSPISLRLREALRIWNVATRLRVICHLDRLALIARCPLPLHLERNPVLHHKQHWKQPRKIFEVYNVNKTCNLDCTGCILATNVCPQILVKNVLLSAGTVTAPEYCHHAYVTCVNLRRKQPQVPTMQTNWEFKPQVKCGENGNRYGKHVTSCVRFEVSTAVTMKNAVFWDIKTQFVLHRRYITSPLQSSAS